MNKFVIFALISYGIGFGGVYFLYQRLKTIVEIKNNFDKYKDVL